MGKTTFTGPIRAGNILNTAGTTLGQDVKNVGSVVMVQTYPITQALTATALGTTIVLPANKNKRLPDAVIHGQYVCQKSKKVNSGTAPNGSERRRRRTFSTLP